MGRREGKCGGKKGSSQKVRGEQTRGLGKAPKAARGRSMKARPTQSRKGVKGGLRPFSSAPCRVKGQRPLWGLGQRPNCSSSDQSQGSRQQRCRQRSVPASNFARPQTRHQAALPSRFREEPRNARLAVGRSRAKGYSVSLLYFLHHGRSVHSSHRGCWALHTLRP